MSPRSISCIWTLISNSPCPVMLSTIIITGREFAAKQKLLA